MATAKKKTNYIGYELEWLEKKCKQLQQWVEDKLDGGISDRIEMLESTRGNPIMKVIASEETQIKCLRDTLKELPQMLLEINRLRKIAEEEDATDSNVRGDHDVPGFMEDDADVEVISKPQKETKVEKPKKESPKALPPSSTFFDEDDDLNDDGDFEDP